LWFVVFAIERGVLALVDVFSRSILVFVEKVARFVVLENTSGDTPA